MMVLGIPGWIAGRPYRVAPIEASPFVCWLVRDHRTTAMERARAVVRMFAEQIEAEAQARDRLRAAPPAPAAKGNDRPVAPRIEPIRKAVGKVRRGRKVYQVDKRGRLILISPRERAKAAL
jgi:hypothetical protein